MKAGTVYLDVRPDMAKFSSSMKSGLGGIESQMKSIGAGLVGAFAVRELGQFFMTSIGQAEEAKSSIDGLRASLNSMGRELSVDIFTKQASDLASLTGITDEAIQEGQGLLATFSNISDELLTKLSPALVDLAARFTGGNITTAAKMMGKALNDPVAGMTALSRAGVQFSQGQKAVITSLVSSGDVAGAQAIILKELERETKGFAEATVTSTQKMTVAWEEFQEFVGQKLLPTFDDLTTGVTGIFEAINEGDTAGGLASFGETLLDLSPALTRVVPGLTGVTTEVENLKDAMDADERVEAFQKGLEGVTAAMVSGSVTRVEAIQQIEDLAAAAGVADVDVESLVDTFIRENGIVTTTTGTIATNTNARKVNAQAIRDQRTAALAGIDSNLAVIDGMDQVAEAHRVVTDLEKKGATSTRKYEDAVLAEAAAHSGLQTVMLAHQQGLKDSETSQREARKETIEWAKALGLPLDVIRKLLPKTKEYNDELDAIPSHVNTRVTATFTTFKPGVRGLPLPGGAHGGIVTRPTMALIGEAGPEAVVPLSRTPGSSPLSVGSVYRNRPILDRRRFNRSSEYERYAAR